MLRRNNRVLRHRIKGGDLFWIEWSERAKCRGDIFFQYLPIYLAASGLGYVTWNPSLRRVDSLLWRRISRSMPQLLWHISLVAPGRVRPYSSTRGQTRVPCIAEELDHGKSKRVPEKHLFLLLTMPKPLTVWTTINCGKF